MNRPSKPLPHAHALTSPSSSGVAARFTAAVVGGSALLCAVIQCACAVLITLPSKSTITTKHCADKEPTLNALVSTPVSVVTTCSAMGNSGAKTTAQQSSTRRTNTGAYSFTSLLQRSSRSDEKYTHTSRADAITAFFAASSSSSLSLSDEPLHT